MIIPEKYTVPTNKQDLKHQRYNQICVITVKHILLLKELLLLEEQIIMHMT